MYNQFLIRKYELLQIDWLNEILEDILVGFCEQCLRYLLHHKSKIM